jgi:hypothetical protein
VICFSTSVPSSWIIKLLIISIRYKPRNMYSRKMYWNISEIWFQYLCIINKLHLVGEIELVDLSKNCMAWTTLKWSLYTVRLCYNCNLCKATFWWALVHTASWNLLQWLRIAQSVQCLQYGQEDLGFDFW